RVVNRRRCEVHWLMLSSAPMILVGLTGGVATGKSTVAALFKRCGAKILDADQLARQVVEPRKPAWRDIVRTFGTTILREDGHLDRQLLADIVFKSPDKLRRLERIIHPRVSSLQRRLTRDIAAKHPHAVIVYEVPLLFEAGVDKRVDTIIVVTADRDTQIARLRQRTGLSRPEALRRIRSQMSLAKKARMADIVLLGTTPRAKLQRQVIRVYDQLRQTA
ncbi:MAG TPA: dephospho-CoA kinase, partial [Nitrospiraceae bacterium]|nr:dephospho-CoA kinase [Nitrospiraceae bacterium]